ncbi:glycosyltransferase family 4 protein [Mariprofundus ferrooxydans]|nr:glycosyltransferase family 4 protein [Mariprofundus ferrooxydans]
MLGEMPGFIHWLMHGDRHSVYLSLSGGSGQLIDMFLLFLARIFAAEIYIHHHSFQYINRYSFLTKCLFWLVGKKALHIVLSEKMAQQLKLHYQSSALHTMVLSNAAFIEGQDKRYPIPSNMPLHIGFMSNVAKEKGIDCFIDLLEVAKQQGVDLRASIAGPFQDEDTRKRIMARINAMGTKVQYIGPQYGQDKQVFFNSLDVLVFPTQYNNEAAPLVIYEALSHGVPVISKARGCIEEMVREGAGLVLSERQFEQGALTQLICWDRHWDNLYHAKEIALNSFLCMQKIAKSSLNNICSTIALGGNI